MKRLELIAATDDDWLIGNGLQMPWPWLPEDMKHFKRVTTEKPMIMGRKTFDSLPGILPERQHLVISRTASYDDERVTAIRSLPEAIELGFSLSDTPIVVGGGEVYRQALSHVNYMFLTHIDGSYAKNDGNDVYFPNLTGFTGWELVPNSYVHHPATEKTPIFSFEEWRCL